ncbi:MAG: hypothetical protein AAFV49_04460 [Pseudomonadota bacterium]
MVLERLDLIADGGLADAHLGCDAEKTAMSCCRFEGANCCDGRQGGQDETTPLTSQQSHCVQTFSNFFYGYGLKLAIKIDGSHC